MPVVRQALAALFLALFGAAAALPVHAQSWWWDDVENGLPSPSIGSSLPNRGDPGDARKWLFDRGITLALEYTGDVLANLYGGTRTGTVYQGKLQGFLLVDLGKAGLLDGLTLFANGFQIHNTGRMRRDYVGGVNTIAAIEAAPATRLSELWLEQSLFGGRASLRVGQLAADSEFFFSETSQLFLQSDWPTIAALNLPSGGPAYPLATPGLRLRVQAERELALLVALFNGNPAGAGAGDEQARNTQGLNFRVTDSPLLIAELQYQLNQETTAPGLATTLKLGGWHHFGTFDDLRFDRNGVLLADPASTGVPRQFRGDSGLYAILDQQLWRPKGGEADSGVTAYARVSVSPGDRNLIGFYVDGGVVFAGLLPGRPDDRFGVGVIHARYSGSARAFDQDTAAQASGGTVRDYETNLELAYRAQIVPGWTIAPTVQWIWHPSGDWTRNAMVVGARTVLRY